MNKQPAEIAKAHVAVNANTVPVSKLRDAFMAHHRAKADVIIAQLQLREASVELKKAVLAAGLIEALDVNVSMLRKLIDE